MGMVVGTTHHGALVLPRRNEYLCGIREGWINLKNLNVFDAFLGPPLGINTDPFSDDSLYLLGLHLGQGQIVTWMEYDHIAGSVDGLTC
jgi:hypothetical protein